jgi:hypothetical protein
LNWDNEFQRATHLMKEARGILPLEADVRVIRGLLDLESGRAQQAADRFHSALTLWEWHGIDFPLRALARDWREELRKVGVEPRP